MKNTNQIQNNLGDKMLKILFNSKAIGKIQDNGHNKMSQALDYLEPKINTKELEEGTIQSAQHI